MEFPLFTYSQNKANSSVKRDEFNREFRDIYYTGKPGTQKDGLGDTDEEQVILNLGKFIPGKIYMFDYDPLYPDALSYYDRKPLIFVNDVYKAEGTKNDIVSGINLHFLPEIARAQTLGSFSGIFKKEINLSEKKAEENKIFLSLNRVISFFKNWKTVLSVYNGAAGLGYQFAYRNYAIKQMKNVRYIEYQHWEMIPFLKPEIFVGAGIEQIYTEYWNSKKTLKSKKSRKDR